MAVIYKSKGLIGLFPQGKNKMIKNITHCQRLHMFCSLASRLPDRNLMPWFILMVFTCIVLLHRIISSHIYYIARYKRTESIHSSLVPQFDSYRQRFSLWPQVLHNYRFDLLVGWLGPLMLTGVTLIWTQDEITPYHGAVEYFKVSMQHINDTSLLLL